MVDLNSVGIIFLSQNTDDADIQTSQIIAGLF